MAVLPGVSGNGGFIMGKKLYRSRTDSVFAGLCGGIAKYLGMDSSVIRVITVILFFAGSIGLWVYILLALIVPKEPEAGFLDRYYGDDNSAPNVFRDNGGYPGNNGYPNGFYSTPGSSVLGDVPPVQQPGAPVYPYNGMPTQPYYGMPGAPTAPYNANGMPAQPYYGMPGAPTAPYNANGMPAQPYYGMPGAPMAPYNADGMPTQPYQAQVNSADAGNVAPEMPDETDL